MALSLGDSWNGRQRDSRLNWTQGTRGDVWTVNEQILGFWRNRALSGKMLLHLRVSKISRDGQRQVGAPSLWDFASMSALFARFLVCKAGRALFSRGL